MRFVVAIEVGQTLKWSDRPVNLLTRQLWVALVGVPLPDPPPPPNFDRIIEVARH